MSVSLSEHLPLLAEAPDGIKKLRGLILELAARGKLVPQDPNDEPASELLKRIARERARQESDGSRKKSKATPLEEEDERLFELPEGWQWVRFEEIAQHNSGKTLDKVRNLGEPREYITTSNLYWGRFELKSVRQMLINEDELERCTARKDDLLICEGGEAGRAAVWPYNYEICFQNHVHRARFFGGIDPYFGYRFFEKLNASGEIDQYRKGVGISNMSGKALASIPFPVPPLAEQHRIVAKVDELMAVCDRIAAEQADAEAAHAPLVQTLLGTLTLSRDAAELATNWQRLSQHFDTLFTTEASLNALKQTILQLAVMGKLVPQDPTDEPASELLKRIAAEKARLVAEGKIKKDKPQSPVGEDEKPFPLPVGWAWVRLRNVVTDSGAGWSPSCESRARNGDEWGVLKVSAVSWGEFDPEANKALPPNLEARPEHQVEAGDFLVSRANTAELVARSVFIERCPSHLMLSDKIVRLRLSTLSEGRYVNLANSCANARDYYSRVAGGTSASMKMCRVNRF